MRILSKRLCDYSIAYYLLGNVIVQVSTRDEEVIDYFVSRQIKRKDVIGRDWIAENKDGVMLYWDRAHLCKYSATIRK